MRTFFSHLTTFFYDYCRSSLEVYPPNPTEKYPFPGLIDSQQVRDRFGVDVASSPQTARSKAN